MANFVIREGESSSFQYSFRGYNPTIRVEFVPGTATSSDGYGGTRIGSSVVNINGYITATYTYSFGAYADTVDEPNESFTLNVYYNGILDQVVTVTILDDEAWHGTAANDIWKGNPERDIYFGYEGDDLIFGRSGNDKLHGGVGNDEIFGGNGNDTIYGEGGRDKIDGGNGDDTLYGGASNDILLGGSGHDILIGGGGKDRLEGGNGNDRLDGSAGNDKLIGGRGNDWLDGGKGDDRLWGGSGDDTLVGGRGNDVLTGGGGADTFAFSRKSGQDKIKDFNSGEGDVIDLSALELTSDFDTFFARRATDTSEGVLLNLPGKSEVLLQGVNIADLSADDFIL